jgi:MYXO-CTERM domain-containing protein
VGGAATYFQSFTGTGWQPTNLGGPFDTAALQQADSFVTIGGFGADALQTPGAGAGSGLDPNFGGNNAAAPGVDAGWYNGSPPSLNGAVMTYANGLQGTLIGRFSSLDGEFSLEGTMFEATWNQGLGTPGQQAGFMVPAPGAMALLGLAGLAGRRRRGH